MKALRTQAPPDPWINKAITRAFRQLEEAGIIALENAGGSSSSGWSVVAEKVAERSAAGRDARGACFYTAQDVEYAVAGKGLYLEFGTVDAQADVDVAKAVIAALAARGVATEWNGDPRRRIHIPPFTWFRPPAR